MATTTNYSWTTPDDTALVKDGALAIRTLGSSVDTTVKNLNPETTTGAISYRGATANQKVALPIGTANQVLRVNSGATAPEWATVSSGGMTLLSTTTLSGSNTTISSISQDYNELHIYIYGVTSGTSSNGVLFCSAYNGATALNASVLRINNSGPVSWTATTGFRLSDDADDNVRLLRTSNVNFWNVIFTNYTQASQAKSVDIVGAFERVGPAMTPWSSRGGIYDTSSANIDSIQIIITGGNTFSTGTCKIYGVK